MSVDISFTLSDISCTSPLCIGNTTYPLNVLLYSSFNSSITLCSSKHSFSKLLFSRICKSLWNCNQLKQSPNA